MFKANLLLWKDVAMLLAILRVKTASAFEGFRDWNEGLPDFCLGIPIITIMTILTIIIIAIIIIICLDSFG